MLGKRTREEVVVSRAPGVLGTMRFTRRVVLVPEEQEAPPADRCNNEASSSEGSEGSSSEGSEASSEGSEASSFDCFDEAVEELEAASTADKEDPCCVCGKIAHFMEQGHRPEYLHRVTSTLYYGEHEQWWDQCDARRSTSDKMDLETVPVCSEECASKLGLCALCCMAAERHGDHCKACHAYLQEEFGLRKNQYQEVFQEFLTRRDPDVKDKDIVEAIEDAKKDFEYAGSEEYKHFMDQNELSVDHTKFDDLLAAVEDGDEFVVPSWRGYLNRYDNRVCKKCFAPWEHCNAADHCPWCQLDLFVQSMNEKWNLGKEELLGLV